MKSTTLLGLPTLASATTHHLFVGTFSGANLYAVEFDDETLALTLAANISAHAAHAWINLSHDKKALYAVEDGGWTSYSVDNTTSLTHTNTLPLTGNCSSDRSIFVLSAHTPPYNVYGDPFSNCGSVLSVDEDGALAAVAQNISYASDSGVHGLALSPDGAYLYSADDSGNSVWTHSVDSSTGLVTELQQLTAPSDGANPRHAAVHPKGNYLYVVLEEANKLAQYRLDAASGLPIFENVTYPLIPESGEFGRISLFLFRLLIFDTQSCRATMTTTGQTMSQSRLAGPFCGRPRAVATRLYLGTSADTASRRLVPSRSSFFC